MEYALPAGIVLLGFSVGAALRSRWALLMLIALALGMAFLMADPKSQDDLSTSIAISMFFIAPLAALGVVGGVPTRWLVVHLGAKRKQPR